MRQAENQRVAFEKRSSVLAPKSGCQTAAVSLEKTFPRQFGNRPLSSERRIRPAVPTAALSPRRARSAHNPTRVGHVLLFFFQLLSPARRPQGTSLISFLSRHQQRQGRPAGAGQRQPTAPAAPPLNTGAGPGACLVPCKRS